MTNDHTVTAKTTDRRTDADVFITEGLFQIGKSK